MRECIWKHKSDSKDTNHSQHLDVSINNNKRVNKMKKKRENNKKTTRTMFVFEFKNKNQLPNKLTWCGATDLWIQIP